MRLQKISEHETKRLGVLIPVHKTFLGIRLQLMVNISEKLCESLMNKRQGIWRLLTANADDLHGQNMVNQNCGLCGLSAESSQSISSLEVIFYTIINIL